MLALMFTLQWINQTNDTVQVAAIKLTYREV